MNNNTTYIEFILSIILAASTVIYTIINLMMWMENRASRHLKSTPTIIAFLRTTENHTTLVLYIKNIGEGFAKDVRLKFLKDYNQFGKENLTLSTIGIAKYGFSIFPSQYELKYYINSMTELYDNKDDWDKNYIELEISYKDKRNKKYKNSYKLPFIELMGQNYSSPPETYLGQIPYYLKEINNNLKEK